VHQPPFWHGLLLHSLMSVCQLVPVYPVPEHSQLEVPGSLSQAPPFWHGLLAHSFTSVWQFVPVYPVPEQEQV
jgi:hypothetical protein